MSHDIDITSVSLLTLEMEGQVERTTLYNTIFDKVNMWQM